MAGHDVPPDESEEGAGNPRGIPRPPPRATTSTEAPGAPRATGVSAVPSGNVPRPPPPRAPANPPVPGSRPTGATLAPRPSQAGTLAPPARATPSSNSAPISRKVPRPSTQSSMAARPPTSASNPQPQQRGQQQPAKGAGGDLVIGQLFASRYRIEKQVGKGGMGAVYLATQEPLSRMVAIKILHGTADDVTVARFQREARLIAQLQHPHIVGLIDFGEDNGRLYLVMEYIDGESLTKVLEREQPFDPARVVDVAIQIAEALAVAHDMNVVHRDVKPDNIMLLKTAGGGDFIKMLDFGVAKIKRDGDAANNNTVETKAGLIVGSLRYISPEQVENGEITPRTDIYSYGAVVYEMLAGRRVFDYASPADCAIAHITEQPKAPVVNGVTLSGPLVDFIMRCLDKKSANRPANAREAIKALGACRAQPLTTGTGASTTAARAAAPTIQQAPGGSAGIDNLQTASTVAISHEQLGRAVLDSQIRRPTGAHDFQIVGQAANNTSTSLQGVRLTRSSPEAVPPPAPKSKWWLWVLVGLLAAGGGFALVMLLGKNNNTPEVPVESSSDAAGEDAAGEPKGDAAASQPAAADAAGEPNEVAAEVAADAGPAPDAAAPAPDAGALDIKAGALLKTEPPGATVLRDKKPVCVTPCIVPWSETDSPPLVRINLKGYIDVDLQFVNADRGTEQNIPLTKRP